jgi:Tfp pilus assembly PilM family ATPase
MARIVAVDWDLREVRCAVATVTAGHLHVCSLAAGQIAQSAEEGNEPPPGPGETLRQLLVDQAAGRAIVLVGVDRGDVEVMNLNLPPAKDSELAELVLLQAMRDSPAVTEQSALDFVPQNTDPAEPRKVQAVLLPAERLDHIQKTCATAGVKPRRILLRSFALASLFARTAHAPERCVMLVDRIGEEVELVVLTEGRPTFQRTVRLPASGDEGKAIARLAVEVGRTAAVALDGEDASPIECVYVLGRRDEQKPLVAALKAKTRLEVKVVDPLAAVGVHESAAAEQPQRFAPLLGMLLDEARGARHMVDFLNPRRAARRPNRRRMLLLAVLAAMVAAMLGLDAVWAKLAQADAENQRLEKDLSQLKKVVKDANERNKTVESVRDWLAGDVDWLDELRDLSIRFPTARDMIVLRFNMVSSSRDGGGEVTLQGVVREPQVVAHMETAVRDEYHEVSSRRVQERVHEKTYSWHFETSISVDRRPKNEYTSHLHRASEGKPSAKTP